MRPNPHKHSSAKQALAHPFLNSNTKARARKHLQYLWLPGSCLKQVLPVVPLKPASPGQERRVPAHPTTPAARQSSAASGSTSGQVTGLKMSSS